mgnify:CR=1 FL=1
MSDAAYALATLAGEVERLRAELLALLDECAGYVQNYTKTTPCDGDESDGGCTVCNARDLLTRLEYLRQPTDRRALDELLAQAHAGNKARMDYR